LEELFMTSHVDPSPQPRQTPGEELTPKVTLAEVIIGGLVLAMTAWVVLPEVSRAEAPPQQAEASRAAQAAPAAPQPHDVHREDRRAGAEDTVTQTTQTDQSDRPAETRQGDCEAGRPAADLSRRSPLGAHRTR